MSVGYPSPAGATKIATREDSQTLTERANEVETQAQSIRDRVARILTRIVAIDESSGTPELPRPERMHAVFALQSAADTHRSTMDLLTQIEEAL